jgi:hypothetical protein
VCPRARNFPNCVSFTHSPILCSTMHSSDGLSSASEVRAKARAIERFLEILHNKPAECVSSTHSHDDPLEVRASALAMALVSRVVGAQRAQHVAATQDGQDNGALLDSGAGIHVFTNVANPNSARRTLLKAFDGTTSSTYTDRCSSLPTPPTMLSCTVLQNTPLQ